MKVLTGEVFVARLTACGLPVLLLVMGTASGASAEKTSGDQKTREDAAAAPEGEGERKKAARLLIDYFAEPKPEPRETARIGALIADMGSEKFDVREAASEKILEYGEKALPELKKALADDDPEVVTRAESAIEKITAMDRQGQILSELRKVRADALAVIDGAIAEIRAAAAKSKEEAASLAGAGQEDAAAEKLKSARSGVEHALLLVELRKQVETDDPLAIVRELIKKGDKATAMRKLQEYVREKQKAGEWTGEEQLKYRELIMQVYRINQGGVNVIVGAP